MSTETYSSPLQEFYQSFTLGAGGAGVFNVFELTPPNGYKIILESFEGLATLGMRWLVATSTLITAGGAAALAAFMANPPGLLSIGRTGTRGDVGVGGYIFAPGVREALYTNAVCDSIADQRFVWICQTANQATELYVHGWFAKAVYDTSDRVVLR